MRTLLPLAAILATVLFLTACFEDEEPSTRFDNTIAADVECRTVATRYGSQLTLVRAAVDSISGWFVLESATSYLLVDSRQLDLAGRVEVGTGKFPRPCKTPVTFYQVDAFTIGRMTIDNAYVGAADLSFLEDAVGEPVMGVVSFPVFKRAVVEIELGANGGQGRVAVYGPASYELERGEWERLAVSGFEMIVRCTFERAVKGDYVIDTGFGGNAAVFSVYAANMKLAEGREFVERPTLTMCGEATERETRIDKFTFAGRTFDDPVVSFLQPGSAADVNSGKLAGVVGRGFLREFTVVTDVVHGRVAFVGDEAEDPVDSSGR